MDAADPPASVPPADPQRGEHGPGDALDVLLAVMQLASPALPVGGFAYSQGLEDAVARGAVADEAGVAGWIADALALVLARHEAPWWLRAHRAAAAADPVAFERINAELLAARETAELRAESRQMGASLARVLPALGVAPPPAGPVAYPAAFAHACAALGVPARAGLAAYLWAWAENQVLVALKTVPLGQQAGQRILAGLRPQLARAVDAAGEAAAADRMPASAAYGLALASAAHETQYSRLFRS